MVTGIVTGNEIKKNRDGENNRRLLQVEITDGDDIQTVELMGAFGDDSVPPIGSKVLVLDVGAAYKIAIAVDDKIDPSMLDGERKLYSTGSDGASIQAFINFLSSGLLELNGNADFAVRYGALETAFNQLKSDYDDFVTTVYPVHTHPTAVAGPPSIPSNTGTASSADISGAKIDEIKVP